MSEPPSSTREYAVCSGSKGFADEGDSGASVLNKPGKLVGILVARPMDAIEVNCVAPIHAVVDNI